MPRDKEKQAARSKEHYIRNIDKIKARSKLRNEKQRALCRKFIADYKKNKPCTDCGGTFHPFAMEFDHCSGAKNYNISDMTRCAFSLDRIKEEIEKCELVCANCHRIRTFENLQSPVA